MPYIEPSMRNHLDPTRRPNAVGDADGPGDLNFQITRLCDEFLARKGTSYFTLNTVIGVLECAKLELYRRVAAPYEDSKIKHNGDVYESLKG